MELEPPVAYQGGKTRIAADIAFAIEKELESRSVVYDLCCGCGAVSLALLNRGSISPAKLVLVDGGLWGAFWSAIRAELL